MHTEINDHVLVEKRRETTNKFTEMFQFPDDHKPYFHSAFD